MRILLAPDKFKSTLTAAEFCSHAQDVLQQQGHVVDVCPLADGGEGTAELLTAASVGSWHEVSAHDPLMRPVTAGYGISGDGLTAFVDLASASGLWRLDPSEYNPEQTSTFGTGELLLDAFSKGVRRIILGCGGSATNDVGLGMASALGFRFIDDRGDLVEASTLQLNRISAIDDSRIMVPDGITVTVISDVTNVLVGKEGAAYVFGPQKGADAAMVERLDERLRMISRVFYNYTGRDVAVVPGAGAGGGFTAGALVFLKAKAASGVATVMANMHFEDRLKRADLVITGEGRLDWQSLNGKVVSGVSAACCKMHKPFWVICGSNSLGEDEVSRLGARRISSLDVEAGSLMAAKADPGFWIRSVLIGASSWLCGPI